ncbi:uncharacterized protein LOC131887448 isoform X2 [Tigriopus californicus]|uniref:uncharacterized protein LOC131887448 isoform X2 n=1 Tax=Tigriopus californicus TaxID=6832 RepID=UPI0027DA21A9|nr:uncharacterized protein LOC131887448 isoform X2 [Tigriopus californicus]
MILQLNSLTSNSRESKRASEVLPTTKMSNFSCFKNLNCLKNLDRDWVYEQTDPEKQNKVLELIESVRRWTLQSENKSELIYRPSSRPQNQRAREKHLNQNNNNNNNVLKRNASMPDTRNHQWFESEVGVDLDSDTSPPLHMRSSSSSKGLHGGSCSRSSSSSGSRDTVDYVVENAKSSRNHTLPRNSRLGSRQLSEPSFPTRYRVRCSIKDANQNINPQRAKNIGLKNPGGPLAGVGGGGGHSPTFSFVESADDYMKRKQEKFDKWDSDFTRRYIYRDSSNDRYRDSPISTSQNPLPPKYGVTFGPEERKPNSRFAERRNQFLNQSFSSMRDLQKDDKIRHMNERYLYPSASLLHKTLSMGKSGGVFPNDCASDSYAKTTSLRPTAKAPPVTKEKGTSTDELLSTEDFRQMGTATYRHKFEQLSREIRAPILQQGCKSRRPFATTDNSGVAFGRLPRPLSGSALVGGKAFVAYKEPVSASTPNEIEIEIDKAGHFQFPALKRAPKGTSTGSVGKILGPYVSGRIAQLENELEAVVGLKRNSEDSFNSVLSHSEVTSQSGSESTIDPDMFTTAEEDGPDLNMEHGRQYHRHPPPAQPVRRQLIPKKSRSRLSQPKTAFDNRTVDVSMEWEACQTNQGFNRRATTNNNLPPNTLASPADWSQNFQTVTSTPLGNAMNANMNGSYVQGGQPPTPDEVDQTAYNTAEEDEMAWNTLTEEESNESQDHETTPTSNGNQNLDEWQSAAQDPSQENWNTVQESESNVVADEQNQNETVVGKEEDAWGTVEDGNPAEDANVESQEDSRDGEEWGTVSEGPFEKVEDHEDHKEERFATTDGEQVIDNQSQNENVWHTTVEVKAPVEQQHGHDDPVDDDDRWQSVIEENQGPGQDQESSTLWASVNSTGIASNDESTLEPDEDEEPYSNTWDQPTDSFHTINTENNKVINANSSIDPWTVASPTSPVVSQTTKSPLKRTKAFKGQSGLCDTEDLYCDDELNGDDPNMQLEIAKAVIVPSPGGDMLDVPEDEESHCRRPYPNQPVLVDQESILSMDFPSTGPTSLRSNCTDDTPDEAIKEEDEDADELVEEDGPTCKEDRFKKLVSRDELANGKLIYSHKSEEKV